MTSQYIFDRKKSRELINELSPGRSSNIDFRAESACLSSCVKARLRLGRVKEAQNWPGRLRPAQETAGPSKPGPIKNQVMLIWAMARPIKWQHLFFGLLHVLFILNLIIIFFCNN